MKKTYMQPRIEDLSYEVESLMNIVSNGDGTLNGGGSQGNLGDSEVLSRRSSSVWDDDDYVSDED